MNKSAQNIPNIPLPYLQQIMRPDMTPAAFNPEQPLVEGGKLQQYSHNTLSAVPKAYQQIPSGIANVTGNPLADQLFTALGPVAASKLGINIKPTIPIPADGDTITAGISQRYVAPAYAQHMQSQQNRAAALMSHALGNSIDEAQIKKINPNWSKNESKQKLYNFFSSPYGATAMSTMPKDSPIGVMLNPENQLFSVRPFMNKPNAKLGPKLAQIADNVAKDFTQQSESVIEADMTSSGNTMQILHKIKEPGIPGSPESPASSPGGHKTKIASIIDKLRNYKF